MKKEIQAWNYIPKNTKKKKGADLSTKIEIAPQMLMGAGDAVIEPRMWRSLPKKKITIGKMRAAGVSTDTHTHDRGP